MSEIRPTLDDLRRQYRVNGVGSKLPSRFHKSPCPECGLMVTNQAMGRKAHMQMHKRKKEGAVKSGGVQCPNK